MVNKIVKKLKAINKNPSAVIAFITGYYLVKLIDYRSTNIDFPTYTFYILLVLFVSSLSSALFENVNTFFKDLFESIFASMYVVGKKVLIVGIWALLLLIVISVMSALVGWVVALPATTVIIILLILIYLKD